MALEHGPKRLIQKIWELNQQFKLTRRLKNYNEFKVIVKWFTYDGEGENERTNWSDTLAEPELEILREKLTIL